MIPPLDVFKNEDGTYIWKGVVENLELARGKAQELGPGEYMIFSQETWTKLIINPRQGPSLAETR